MVSPKNNAQENVQTDRIDEIDKAKAETNARLLSIGERNN